MRTIQAGTKESRNVAFLEWLAAHDINVNSCYRVDIEDESMTVHCFKLNKRGAKHTCKVIADGEVRTEVATHAPYKVDLKSECPL